MLRYLLNQIQISKPVGIFFKLVKRPSEHTIDVILLPKLFPCFDMISKLTFIGEIGTLSQSDRVSAELYRNKLHRL